MIGLGFCKVVSIQDIEKGNPKLCLSALRYTGHCFKCPCFVSSTGKPCNSRIVTEEARQHFILQEKKTKLQKEIDLLKGRMEAIK